MNTIRNSLMTAVILGSVLCCIPAMDAYELGPEVSVGHWGILPDADAAPNGDILLLYGENGVLFYQKIHNGQISEPDEVGGVGHSAILYKDQDPRIASDMDGNPHVVWTPQVTWYYVMYSYFDGSEWHPSSLWDEWSEEADIDVDTNNKDHVVLHEIDTFATRYIRAYHGDIETTKLIMDSPGPWEPATPRIEVDVYGNVHADMNGGFISPTYTDAYIRYDTATGTWGSLEHTFQDQIDLTGGSSLTTKPDGNAVVCTVGWVSREVGWQKYLVNERTPNGWGSTYMLDMVGSQVGEMPGIEIASDASGNLCAAWKYPSPTGKRVKFSIKENGGEWSEPQYITENPALQEFPCVVASGNTFYVFYTSNAYASIVYRTITTNKPPQVQLGGCTLTQMEEAGNLGGEFNFLALVTDGNGQNDITSVRALDSQSGAPLFNLYDDGQHGDLAPGDSIYGALLSQAFYRPGERQTILIQATDSRNASSDIYPYITIHGSGSSSDYEQSPSFPSWETDYQKSLEVGNGEWTVYMGGFLDTNIRVGSDSWLDIIAWVYPLVDHPMTSVNRVELMYSDVPFMNLPLIIDDDIWGKFYATSLPLPGDSLTQDLANLMIPLQIRVIDSNGNSGPVWPHIEIPNPPTETPVPTFTPEPTATKTPRPTMPPMDTPTMTPTATKTPRPTMPPMDTPTMTPASTNTPLPTMTPQPTIPALVS